MNVFLHKKSVFLLLGLFLWGWTTHLKAQSYTLEIIDTVMLMNTTAHFTFKQYGLNTPQTVHFPTNNQAAYFEPYSYGNKYKFGVKGLPGVPPNNFTTNHLYYTPPQGFLGRDTVEVLCHKPFGSGAATIQVYRIYHITVVPSFIHAENDYASTFVNQAVSIPVLLNDIGNGTNQTIAEIANINHGTAVKILGGTQISFTPNAGFSGLAHLNYTICDSQGSCDMATVSICVNQISPPSYDSVFIMTEKNTAQVVLMQLDSNFSVQIPPSHGTLDTLETLVYVPGNDYVGLDKVTFHNAVHNRTRVFSIHVLNVPAPNAFAFDDVVYTAVDVPIEEIHLLANDNGAAYLSPVNAIGYPNTHEGGTLTFLSGAGTGVYRYNPPAGFSGIDYFKYKAYYPNSSQYDIATCYIIVSNMNPVKPVYQITIPKNTPLVLGDHLPIPSYEFININEGDGSVKFYPGFNTVTDSVFGQTFSGYNMLVYSPVVDAIGNDEFEFNYCPVTQSGNCPLVKVEIEIVDMVSPQGDTLCAGGECVWPGDVNTDGSVDVRDILPIGLCMGEVGAVRNNGSVAWYGQYSDNWNNLFAPPMQFNGKHIDTDGNGIVTHLDTTAIGQFYGKYHNLTPAPMPAIKSLPFYLQEPEFTNIQPGDVLYAPIHLGNDSIPAISAYGLTFELEYDPTIFESVKVYFSDTAWMSYNSPILSMTHKPFNGKLDAGYTRTSGVSASGYGNIGLVEFIVVEDINGLKLSNNSTTVNLNSSSLMNGNGQTFGLKGNSLTFYLDSNGEGDIATSGKSELVVFPNPAQQTVNLHVNGYNNEIGRIMLFDMVGKTVYDSGDILAKRSQLDVSSLNNGMYVVRVVTSTGEVLSSKVEVFNH
ncbi:MAG: Ig-like domain-containing protein [Saprospiraceae bacterium]